MNLPRPTKDLRIAELWGVEEKLLHSPKLLGDAIERVIKTLGLHPVSDIPFIHEFSPFGISYVRLLEESHLAGHTYFEEDGHLDLQIATCAKNVNLDPLADLLYEVFRPKLGGYCYQFEYPKIETLNNNSGPKVTFSHNVHSWTIKAAK